MSERGDDEDGQDLGRAPRVAEYVLGVLTPAEEERVRDEAADNPLLRAEIARWEQHLASFADELPPAPPPDSVWRGVRRAMAAESVPGAAARAQMSGRRLLWDDANFWRPIAFLSTTLAAIACVVALAAVFSMDLRPPQSRLVASLAAGEGRAAFVATYDPMRHQMLVVPAALVDNAERRVPELWLVTKDKRVVPLGIVDAVRPHAVTIPPALVAETSAGAGLIITLEPKGGAPDGVATGPAIAKGELAPI